MMDEEGCVEHEDHLRLLLMDGVEEDGGLDSSNPPLGQNLNATSNGSSNDPFMRSKQKKKERELNEFRRKQMTLLHVRNLIGIMLGSSLFVFD